jgi:hypothetical protein
MYWYHRQFTEAAEARYCSDQEQNKVIHSNLADFFNGTWANGNRFVTKIVDLIGTLNCKFVMLLQYTFLGDILRFPTELYVFFFIKVYRDVLLSVFIVYSGIIKNLPVAFIV